MEGRGADSRVGRAWVGRGTCSYRNSYVGRVEMESKCYWLMDYFLPFAWRIVREVSLTTIGISGVLST